MPCGIGPMFYFHFVLTILVVVVALAWCWHSIRFFKKASDFLQQQMDSRQARTEYQNEMLAKLDQLVDVLKVK